MSINLKIYMILKFIIHIQLRLKISQEMHDVSVDKILIVDLIITVTSMSITKTKVVMFKSYTCIFYLELSLEKHPHPLTVFKFK